MTQVPPKARASTFFADGFSRCFADYGVTIQEKYVFLKKRDTYEDQAHAKH